MMGESRERESREKTRKRRRIEEDVKNIKMKLKDMERRDIPSFPLDIVVFNLILYHTPYSTTVSRFIIIGIYIFIPANNVANWIMLQAVEPMNKN